ncbi:MAG: hypothetical protein ACKV19_04595 [Verrucomicrobiales bacterium]
MKRLPLRRPTLRQVLRARLPEGWSPPGFCDCIIWSGVLGNFLLGFEMLDDLVTLYLKSHLQSAEFSRLREKGFKDRIDRMARVFQDRATTLEEVSRFDALARRVEC